MNDLIRSLEIENKLCWHSALQEYEAIDKTKANSTKTTVKLTSVTPSWHTLHLVQLKTRWQSFNIISL